MSNAYFAPTGGGDRGDKAGEHLDMQRGRYGAGIYVFFAFLLEIVLAGAPAWILLHIAIGILFRSGALENVNSIAVYEVLSYAPVVGGLVCGIPIAWLVFHDRWKTIEAYSSRYCSGCMNLSLIYVPFVALVYANVRGFKKLGGG